MTQAKLKIRLYVPEAFAGGSQLMLPLGQSHYLANVMRLKNGDGVLLFNGQDGQWQAEVVSVSKKSVTVSLLTCLDPQKSSPDVWLAFAPIKNKVDLVVEKAVELGVSNLLTVFTHHSVVRSVNHEKLMAHAVEAAEQCGRHDVPKLSEVKDIGTLVAEWPQDRTLLFADESGGGTDLRTLLPTLSPQGKYGILIGPEGGFSKDEQQVLKLGKTVHAFGMGPRILRADTASVAALACVQAWLGDWNQQPAYEAENMV